jgi:RNA polymerase sigma-70 factor (ECF subfamily)
VQSAGFPDVNPDLEQVLRDNRDRLARIARQYAGAADQQDLLQEMAVALWQGLPRFEGRSKLSTWVFRVALNTALQYARRKRPAAELLEHEPLGSADVGDPLALLDDFLNGLDPVNRGVLVLDLEGLDRSEIADVLGLTPGAVAVRMTRLKGRFREQYMGRT